MEFLSCKFMNFTMERDGSPAKQIFTMGIEGPIIMQNC